MHFITNSCHTFIIMFIMSWDTCSASLAFYLIVKQAEFHFFPRHLHGSTYSLTWQNFQVNFGTDELRLIQGSASLVLS